MVDAAIAIQEQTLRRPFRWGFLKEREICRLSSIFGAARKYGSGWIGQVKMFSDSNGQIKLHAKQKYKFLSATNPLHYAIWGVLENKTNVTSHLNIG